MAIPGNGQRKMPNAWRCQYRTAHCRRASAVTACEVETSALFCRGPSGAKAGAGAADPICNANYRKEAC
jgi:hypothetical protein